MDPPPPPIWISILQNLENVNSGSNYNYNIFLIRGSFPKLESYNKKHHTSVKIIYVPTSAVSYFNSG